MLQRDNSPIKSHRKLPCLVFDNTDQFDPIIQDRIYQLAHSYEVDCSVFNVVPITDRTIWRLSKAGSLQSYSAKSFYLPVPDAKKIISRRVQFLKSKVELEPSAARNYFSQRGFLVETNDLAILADAVGKVFVDSDYISGLIGRLGNFDIRRMLKLAERIFLSPEMQIDDIILSKFGGESVTADKNRTYRALIRGEYDRFSEDENEFVSNLFYTDARRPGSPLLAYYVLWLLRQKLNSSRPDDDNIEHRHWIVSELCQLFEGCGVAEELVFGVLNRLHDRRLIEAMDPNADNVAMHDRITVKESGMAHIDLVLNSDVYIEQMALVTGLVEIAARDAIKKHLTDGKLGAIRDEFIRYVLKIDGGRLGIPDIGLYEQIGRARKIVQSQALPGHVAGHRRV